MTASSVKPAFIRKILPTVINRIFLSCRIEQKDFLFDRIVDALNKYCSARPWRFLTNIFFREVERNKLGIFA